MRSKILVVFLALLALFGLQLTVLSTPANAWSGSLPQCNAWSFPYAWQSAIQADSRYNSTTTWVAFERSWGGSPYNGYSALVVDWTPPTLGNNRFEFVENSGGNYLSGPSHSITAYQVKSTGLIEVSGNFGTIADLYCVQDVHNVLYSSNYSMPHYPDSVATNLGSLEYVAMGDSYSSGEGVPYFLYGTDTSTNKCHRSENAYPSLLDRNNTLDLQLTSFVACSGATTDTLLNGGSGAGTWGEGAQLDALSSSTDIVTLTIGGNDVGFASVLEACVRTAFNTGWGCSVDTAINDDLDDRLDALAGTAGGVVFNPDGRVVRSLTAVIEAIATEAPNASIYIAGYPHLFGDSTEDYEENLDAPGDAVCVGVPGATFAYDDTQWLNNRADELNQVIEDAVDVAYGNSIDVTYVSPALFGGHVLCDSSTPWINDVVVDSFSPLVINSASFHPDVSGQSLGYSLMFETAMD